MEKHQNIRVTISDAEKYHGADVVIKDAVAIEPGLYRADEGLNQSFIKKALDHGMHTARKMVDEQDEPTDDMLIGSVFHAIMSDKQELVDSFIRIPKLDRRTKDGKAAYESMTALARENGKTLVQENLWETAEGLTAGAKRVVGASIELNSGKMLTEVPLKGMAEAKFRMPDEYSGYWAPDDRQGWNHEVSIKKIVKGQLDAIFVPDDQKLPIIVIDYKTAPSSTTGKVIKKSRDDMWRLQGALYAGLASSYYNRPAMVMYVVVGKDTGSPRAYLFGEKSLLDGRAMLANGIIRIASQSVHRDMTDDEYFGITVI
jgi:hypothetical protein